MPLLWLWLALARPDVLTPHGEKAVVLLFVRPDCPISNRYAPEIQRLQKVYAPSGIEFHLVYPERGLNLAAIEQHRREYGYTLPAIADRDHRYTGLAQAHTTPEAAVFVAGRLVYRGRIDDRFADFGKARPEPARRDLDAVLAAISQGRAVAFRETRAIGCAIEEAP